jgi:hypothetical protein
MKNAIIWDVAPHIPDDGVLSESDSENLNKKSEAVLTTVTPKMAAV